eukprot:scaffold13318_cov92-Amphora_coffeaeformis.AAC.1
MSTRHPKEWDTLATKAQNAISKYRWEVMGPIYDEFFAQVAAGISISDVPTSPDVSSTEETGSCDLTTTSQKEQPAASQQRRIQT